MVRRWRIFGEFLRPVFSTSRMQHVSDLHFKFALRPHRVWKYRDIDIQPATAENRRGKQKKKEEETTAAKYNGLPCLAAIIILLFLTRQLRTF